jgi:hypothetical protein
MIIVVEWKLLTKKKLSLFFGQNFPADSMYLLE